MYKFPYGKRMATMTPESFFDCIDLPAFSVDAFAPEARAKAIRDYCSYVLSTFNYNGLKPRGMLLRLDIEGAYFPTIELLNADGKQGVAPDNIRLGYVVTMTEQLDAVVTSLLTAKDSVEIHRHPSDVVAAIYVVTDGMFSKRSGTVTFSPRQAALNAVTVELPNLNYTGKCDIARPVKFSQSLYASRCRSLSAGDLNVTADGQFHFVPTKDFLRNLMVMNIVDHDESATFSFGLNGLTLSVHNEKDRVTDLYTAQLNGLIVPPYVHEIPADTAVVIESAVDGKETYEEWHAREAAFNTPELLPVIYPARAGKFVDPNLITPWTVKTPTGEYATSFLKLGSGNLFDVFQFWGEQEHYRIDADAGIADLLIAITHRVEVGEPIVEYHKVSLPEMRFYLEEDARNPHHRKLTNQCQAIVGTRDYFGNPSSLVMDIGLAVRVTLTGSLNLDQGSWALNGQNVFAFAREGDPAHDYQFKILGWTPRMRALRVNNAVDLSSEDEVEARIPVHLLDIAYGAYLAGLVEGQEAMPRAVFASQPSKPLHDVVSALNFARGMAAKHVRQEEPRKEADNPCSIKKEDVQLGDPAQFKSSGTMLMKADSVTVQSAQPLVSSSQGITLTGDPVQE